MTKGNLERKPRQKYNLKITPEIEQFIKNYKKTICLDETSIYLNMTLSYGRSKSDTKSN